MSKPLRVLMIGPGLQVRGGVASVERLILQHLPGHLRARHVATMVDGSALKKALVYLVALLKVFLELARGADVVHIHFSGKASTIRKTIIARMAMLFGRPVIMHAHGGNWHVYIETVRPWFRNVVLKTLKRSGCVIGLSESWRQYFSETCGVPADRVISLPNPVSIPSELPDRSRRDVITFAYLGIMDDGKGAPTVVRAFALLPDEVKRRSRVVMAGAGEVDRIRAMVEELGVSECFAVHNWLEPIERDRVLAESDVLVLPSHHEGMPMAMLEAMAWGLPPITTPVGGIPEVVKSYENGILIPPGDPQALANAMQELTLNEDLRKKLSSAARRAVEPLCVKHYIERLVALYVRLAAGESASGV